MKFLSEEAEKAEIVVLRYKEDGPSWIEFYAERLGSNIVLADRPEKASEIIRESRHVYACFVEESFLKNSGYDHESVFQSIAGASSFIGIYTAESESNVVISSCIQMGRCTRSQTLFDSLIVSNSEPRPGDLEQIRGWRDRHNSTDIQFLMGDLDIVDRTLLSRGLRDLIQRTAPHFDHEKETVTITSLPGGFSGARIFLVEGDGVNRTWIAKIGSENLIREEASRTLYFAEFIPTEVIPYPFFLRGKGLLLTTPIFDENETGQALSLNTFIRDLWSEEIFRPKVHNLEEDERDKAEIQHDYKLSHDYVRAAHTIENALEQLIRMSGVSLYEGHSGRIENYQNLKNTIYLEHIPDLLKNNKLSDLRLEYERYFEIAHSAYEKFNEIATVHGDFHPDNILLRGPRSTFIIDFTSCGPGHPATDIARLDLSVFTRWYVDEYDQASMIDIQICIFDYLLSEGSQRSKDKLLEMLEKNYPEMFNYSINRFCISTVVDCAMAGFELMQTHGIPQTQYLLVRFLLAWQYLTWPDSHRHVTRAALRASARYVNKVM